MGRGLRISRHSLIILIVALAYGSLLASLPLEAFLDRVNYLHYAKNSWAILERYWSVNPLVWLSNEPMWLLINSVLAEALTPEFTLRVIIFVPATLVAWVVLHRDSHQFIWLLWLLLLPQVIFAHIIHLRQGVAIAVFLSGWFATSRPLRWLLLAITPFIHAAFFFILTLLALNAAARRLRLAADLHTLAFIGAGLGISVSLDLIAPSLGARQAERYELFAVDVSGLGFIFWCSIFGAMCLQGRTFMRHYAFELGIIVFYLATYFLIEVSARIFESVILLVLLAGLRLTGWRRWAFLSLIASYGIAQYVLRIDQPWLGLGAL